MKKDHEQYYLGLDTSAYTTSLALVDQDEMLIFDCRKPLPVKEGSLGLRQSEAIFAHLNQLPELWDPEAEIKDHAKIAAVAYSSAPRPVKNSYMPVFKVSEALGLFLARTMGFNYLSSTHQEAHVMAGLWSAGLNAGRYLVVHLSGGTTEIISAEEYEPGCLKLELLGGSSDLNAGQFIDRLGKAMGFAFPAGPALEKLAKECKNDHLELPIAVKKNQISFSGPASHAERLLHKGCHKEELARAIERCIADSVINAVTNLSIDRKSFDALLAVGGVISNKFIRSRLKEKLTGWKVYFADPEYAGDNAVGLAVLAARYFR
ncbi:MAG: O-sialoglycoprotein endopeptidase [Bacillota bacterium]